MLRAALTALASVALVASSACIVPSISTGGGDAGSSSSTSSSADGGSASTTVLGATCTEITSSISLCQYISACPDFSLNVKVFPECGFRIHGTAIDPECLCDNEYLCPVGSPTTCAEAEAAAGGDTTYDSVCQQIATGGCKDLTAGTSSGGSTTTTACQQCVSSCDNVPSCIDACGC